MLMDWSPWISVTFVIPVEVSGIRFWPLCKNKRYIYCLSEIETRNNVNNPAVEFGAPTLGPLRLSTEQKYLILQFNALQASIDAFQPIFQKHNFFRRGEKCCAEQFSSYFHYGLQSLKITPKQYLAKLIDYTEANKTLNLIWSYYMKECNVNIITKLGFGQGQLERSNDRSGLMFHRNDAPYRLKVGKSWTPEFPFENPEHFLTFNWFKKNVMCLDQPWICKQR